ncbi:MAG: TIGR04283 family arsenosugar biosynthesis glycosyltransferase [Pseudomonadales bacterium]
MSRVLPKELSIVIPVLNDGPALHQLLEMLRPLGCELIVADGGSTDIAVLPEEVRWLRCAEVGRGQQLASGVACATGDWLWLLHADSVLSPNLLEQLLALDEPGWGCFDVQLDSSSKLLAWVARFMNWRSSITAICTGDQGIFVHRSLLEQVGGIPAQPLMEDIELCRRLKRLQRPIRRPGPLLTSARRWQQAGAWRTIWLMWSLRMRYWLGATPQALAARYYGRSK